MVKIDVDGQETWALIDSGADISMINQDFARKAIHKDAIQCGPFGHVTEAGGGTVSVTGKAHVPFQIRNTQFLQPMAVIPGLVYQVILGRDFCCQHRTTLDDRAGVFRIGKHEIPLPTYEELRPRRSKVVTCSAVTIPPRSKLMVDIGIRAADGGRKTSLESPWHGILEPHLTDARQDWYIPRIVATVSDNDTIPVQLTNIQERAVTIQPNTEIGTFYTVQDDGGGMYEVLDGNDAITSIVADDKSRLFSDLHIEEAAVSDAGKRVLKRLINEYSSIFSENDEDIGKTTLLKHHIDTGNAAPVRQRPRRIPLRLREEVEKQKNKMLRDGIIEESSSPWCSPIVLAKKKDGSFRFCVDLRAVNSVTQSLPHPLPRVDDALDSLAGARFFSTLDMASGYWQVDLADEDKEKTAFTTGRGLHQFRAMPFGLKNAGATFQRLMELILAGMESRNCLVYIDDVIVFGATEQAHLKNLEEVFQRIRDAGMKLKPRKCRLARDEVVFLGHKVNRSGIQPDPANVEKVKEWPRPEKAEDLKSFLGLTGYYSKFVPGYSDLVKPIREEAEKKGQIEWSDELIESFECLKRRLTSPPILALPKFKGCFKLATDASNSAVGAVLTETIDGEENVLAYASKVLSKTERRWPTYDKELWAIVWAIRHFRQYLVGGSFEVQTDHKPLLNAPQSISVDKDATGRRGRWAVELSTYDFTVTYRKGSDNGNADAMSRRTGEGTGEEEISTELHAAAMGDIEPLVKESTLQNMKLEQELDPILGKVKEWVAEGKYPPKKKLKKCNRELRFLVRFFDQMIIVDDILKIQLERDEKTTVATLLPRVYRDTVMTMLHNDRTAGHLGVARTKEKVLERFFWPTVEKDVREHCETCIQCQRRSQPTPQRQAGFRTEVCSRPFERVAIDITEMPMSSRGNKYALVVMDYFTKYVHIYPMADQTAQTVSGCLLDVVLQEGVPERIHSDQGRQFEAAVFKQLCARLGIEKTRTSPYRPQSDGMVERFNRTLKDMVAKYIKPCGSDWDEHIRSLAFAYNTSKHSVTGYSPFFLIHGREARLPVDMLLRTEHKATDIDSYLENTLQKLSIAFDRVKENTQKAVSEMVQRQKDICREARYIEGQSVWVKDHTAHAGGKRKLGLHYKGPGKVVQMVGPSDSGVVYRIKMPDGKEVKVHHNHLKPAKTRQEDMNEPRSSGRTHKENVTETTVEEDMKIPDLVWALESCKKTKVVEEGPRYVTHYGRVVQPVQKYQA